MSNALANAVIVALVAFLPAIEVRGAIPLAYTLFGNGWGFAAAVALATASNIIVAPVALAVLRRLESWLLSHHDGLLARIGGVYVGVVKRVSSRRGVIERWGYLGLAAFVAIPLPGSGAWTGALLAHILRLKPGRAVASITAGVLIASLIVTLATEGVIKLISA